MALKAASQFGICAEATWPSVDANIEVQPSAAAFAEALNYKAGTYYRINTPYYSIIYPENIWFNSDYLLFSVQYALAKGYPVQMAFTAGAMLENLAVRRNISTN